MSEPASSNREGMPERLGKVGASEVAKFLSALGVFGERRALLTAAMRFRYINHPGELDGLMAHAMQSLSYQWFAKDSLGDDKGLANWRAMFGQKCESAGESVPGLVMPANRQEQFHARIAHLI